MKRILKSQDGMSIVQVLIAAAMMGGLALVMGKLGQNQSKMQSGARYNSDVIEITTRVQKYLASSEVCNANFQNETFQDNPNKDPNLATEYQVFKNKDGTEIFNKTDKPISPLIKLDKIYVHKVNNNQLVMQLILEKGTAVKKSFGAKKITKNFIIDAIFTGNNLDSCYSDFQGAAAAACAASGPNAVIINGQCLNGRICDVEKIALAASMAGGTTTACNENVPIDGIGLYNNIHSIHGCANLGGTVVTINNKKLCSLSGACPSGWTTEYTKTGNKASSGSRKCGCSRPSCSTGGHSSWGTGRETCTHYNMRRKRGLCIGGCVNRDGIKTVYSYLNRSACY